MDVLVVEIVLAAGCAEGIEGQDVEDWAEVRVEGIVALAGEDRDASGQVVDGGIRQRVVVGGVAGRGDAHDVGRGQQIAAEDRIR